MRKRFVLIGGSRQWKLALAYDRYAECGVKSLGYSVIYYTKTNITSGFQRFEKSVSWPFV